MTVVVSGGKATPLGDVKAWPLAGFERGGRQLSSTKALELIGVDLRSSYVEIYRSQPWVYAVVNKITRNIARLRLQAGVPDDATGAMKPLERAHPLPLLLSRPYPRGSRFSLVEATVGSLCTYGHAMWWKYRPRAGQEPVELWPLDWKNIAIITGNDAPIDHYEYQALGGRKVLLPEDVVHFTWWSPAGIRGTSPLEPLRTTLSLEDAGRRYAIAAFANGVRPSGALVNPKSMTPEAKNEVRAELEGAHSMPDNAFRMLLLDGGLDWKAFSHTAQEAQTIEHRKLNQIEVCAAYDMPPTMLQILDHATFSNIDEQHRMLYQDTLGPVVANVEATIGAQLIWGEPRLGAAEGAEVAFNMDDVLRADIVKRAAAYAAMRAAGGLSINDIRASEGKPRIDHPAADAVLIPLNMEAVGSGGVGEDIGLAPRVNPKPGSPADDPTAPALAALAAALNAKADDEGVEATLLATRLLEHASIR